MFKQLVCTTAGLAVANAASKTLEGPINGLGYFSATWQYDDVNE